MSIVERLKNNDFSKDELLQCLDSSNPIILYETIKYSLQGTTQGRYLTGGVPPVRFSM